MEKKKKSINVWKTLKDRIQGKAPKGARRDSQWSKVRKKHLKKQPYCQVCGSDKKLEVHHIIPFHVAPDLELEPSNLMTLCENGKYGITCHQLIGHLGNYRKINSSAEIDAATWRMKLGVYERNSGE